MAFISDKEELKPGLVIFRREDVQHRNWYCRVKLPKADRYKTVSLKTEDVNAARALAWDQDGEVRYSIKHDVPIFNRPFRDVAKEYLATQIARAKRGEISKDRPEKIRTILDGPLNEYVGSTQVTRIGDDLWGNYPAWRRENGEGRAERNGSRKVTRELAEKLVRHDQANFIKSQIRRGYRAPKFSPEDTEKAVAAKMKSPVPFISDATIRFEMAVFGAVMEYGVKKRYVPASQRFEERPKLKVMRRDEFSGEEYRKLYEFARNKWVKAATTAPSKWYREVAYNFVLIMCNTGMRPSEAKNLRWRDVTTAKDRDGQEMMVLFVQGKDKTRKLVAPAEVGKYLNRIREKSKATGLNDPVFTTQDGKPAKSLYQALIEDLLIAADLRTGQGGTVRSTYCFRHTYATFRLSEGVDVYFLAEQMGTSVKMIEDHYGHVNTIKHADRVLQGMNSWEGVPTEPNANIEADAKAAKGAKLRLSSAPPNGRRPQSPSKGKKPH